METKKVLLYGGLAIGGYLLYRHYQSQQATAAASSAAASASPGVASTLTNPTSIPQSGVIAPPIVTMPQVPIFAQALAPATSSGSASAIDPTVVSVVQKWAMSDGRPPVLTMMNAMVPSEYQGMYNIITNFWDTNTPPDANATAFWDALRTKYDPNHLSW